MKTSARDGSAADGDPLGRRCGMMPCCCCPDRGAAAAARLMLLVGSEGRGKGTVVLLLLLLPSRLSDRTIGYEVGVNSGGIRRVESPWLDGVAFDAVGRRGCE